MKLKKLKYLVKVMEKQRKMFKLNINKDRIILILNTYKDRIIIIILTILLLIIAGYIYFKQLPYIFQYISKDMWDNILKGIGISIVFTIFLIIFVLILERTKISEKILNNDISNRKWVYSTIILMVIILIVGFVTIQNYFDESKLSAVLTDRSNESKTYGYINCEDKINHKTIIGHKLYCVTNPKIDILNGSNIKLYFHNNKPPKTYELINSSSEDSRPLFIAPEGDVYQATFEILWQDENHKKIKAGGTDNEFRFYTKQEIKENNNKSLTYFILLLGAVLFSVPSMMKNFKSLAKK